MSKYITHFQTEAAYNTALPTLDLPNVSLVDELGEVHYHRALYGAHAGDIALYDVAEGQKIVVTAADWNLTTYPTASYPIIGVVVADETVAGCKVMSTFCVGTDGTPSSTDTKYAWENTAIDWGLTKYSTDSDVLNDMNGKTNTATIIAAIKAYDLAHSTDNITGNIPDVIQKYAPTGTNPGDWYIPSCGESHKVSENKTVLTATFNKINSASSSAGLPASTLITFNRTTTSDEYTDNYAWTINYTNGYLEKTGVNKQWLIYLRPFTII